MQALLNQQARRLRWEVYTADSIGALVTRLFRWSGAKDFDYPLYSELTKPKQKEMTADEVKQRLLKQLTGEGNEDGSVHTGSETDA